MNHLNSSIEVLGTRLDLVQIPEVIEIMESWISHRSIGNYIVTTNANTIVLSKKDPKIKEAVNKGNLSVPDGISLVLLSKLYGKPLRRRVYGPDLMLKFLKNAEGKGYSNFFYGSTELTLKALVKNLKKRFPSLNIAGIYSPPFSDTMEEDEKAAKIINEVSPDVLWVGLGCPKQQLWMYKNKDKMKVPVMVGIGAAFDFLAQTKSQAPRWIRDNGFEWIFRLITEPKRLWRRYLINNSLFVFYVTLELISNAFTFNKNKPN